MTSNVDILGIIGASCLTLSTLLMYIRTKTSMSGGLRNGLLAWAGYFFILGLFSIAMMFVAFAESA
jgi:hypothetical protein